MNRNPAKGKRGHILYVHGLNTYVFRIYNEDHTFTDYEIHHCDLEVTIEDEDAFLYNFDGKDILDHSPQTLGIA